MKRFIKNILWPFWVYVKNIVFSYFHNKNKRAEYISLIHDFNKRKELIIPHLDLSDIFGEHKPDVKLINPKFCPGTPSLDELYWICMFVSFFKPKKLFEFGTFSGMTTLHMAINSPPDAKIFTLDLEEGFNTGDLRYNVEEKEKNFISFDKKVAFEETQYSRKIKRLYGDSAKFDFSLYQYQMDLIFIDASHSYNYVKNDSELAFNMLLSKSGIIIWHDYSVSFPGVVKYLNEIKEQQKLRRISHSLVSYFNENNKYLNNDSF